MNGLEAPSVLAADPKAFFQISLAQWSLVKTLRSGEMANLDFPRVAKEEYGIDCIEFVDQFFSDKSRDTKYLTELRKRASDLGVKIGLIMLDTTGALGNADKKERDTAVEKTFAWIDAAKFLGCHTVRVNALGGQDPIELKRSIVESCSRLSDYAAERKLNIAIENHGGLSSDPEWLVSVMKEVDKPNFGTLPDFGNFPGSVNRYDAVEMMMPFAKAVSAKSGSFTPDGREANTDYFRMMRIVMDGGYRGHVGIESGGSDPDGEDQAIRLTKVLLEEVRTRFSDEARATVEHGIDHKESLLA
jgi:sugar phosphate isomerase/epimerase